MGGGGSAAQRGGFSEGGEMDAGGDLRGGRHPSPSGALPGGLTLGGRTFNRKRVLASQERKIFGKEKHEEGITDLKKEIIGFYEKIYSADTLWKKIRKKNVRIVREKDKKRGKKKERKIRKPLGGEKGGVGDGRNKKKRTSSAEKGGLKKKGEDTEQGGPGVSGGTLKIAEKKGDEPAKKKDGRQLI